jgi:transcription elongation factor Elf1
MEERTLPVTCPLCGRSSDHLLENLKEGENMVCSFCGVKLNLHGHMWEEIRNEIEKLKSTSPD